MECKDQQPSGVRADKRPLREPRVASRGPREQSGGPRDKTSGSPRPAGTEPGAKRPLREPREKPREASRGPRDPRDRSASSPKTTCTKGRDGRYTVNLDKMMENRKSSTTSPAPAAAGKSENLESPPKDVSTELSEGKKESSTCEESKVSFRNSRERTRVSAVQRLVERKLAQKEKERVKVRARAELNLKQRSASAHQLPQFAHSRRSDQENEYLASLDLSATVLRTSRSCDRAYDRHPPSASGQPTAADASAKTYITIAAGKPARIREHSPSKANVRKLPAAAIRTVPVNQTAGQRRSSLGSSSGNSSENSCSDSSSESETEETKKHDVLRDVPPLKSTGLFREFTFINEKLDSKFTRKTSFTTEKTFVVNPPPTEARRISLDVVFGGNPGVNKSGSSSSESTTPTVEAQQRHNSPNFSSSNSPNFSTSSTSSGFSSSSSNLSSGSSSCNSSSSSQTDISNIGSDLLNSNARRRVSLEQRFRARAVKPTIFPSSGEKSGESVNASSSGWDAPKPRARRSSSRLAAAAASAAELAAAHAAAHDRVNSPQNGPTLGSAGGYRFHKTTSFEFSRIGPAQRKFSQASAETSAENRPKTAERPPRAAPRKISLPTPRRERVVEEESSQEEIIRSWSLRHNTDLSTVESQADQKKEEGNQLYKTRNYREALEKYSEAISLCPGTAAFYGNRSACHMMLSQFTQALEDAKNAVQLDADFVKGYIRVAKCCISLGDLRSAEAALERVLELDPAQGSNLVNQEQASLAQLKKFQADTEQAYNVKDYRKALFCIDRSLSVALASRPLKVARAECLAYLGRYSESQEIANDLLRLDNMNADAIYVRGLCLYYEDNVDKAFTHFQHVLRLAPDHQKAKDVYKKARVLKQKKQEGNEAFKAGKLVDAHKLYSEALEIDSCNKFTNAKLYFNRATVAAKLKKVEESIADCSSALELDPKYLKALLRRAKSHLDLEHFEEAVQDYEAAARMDPGNREVKQSLHQAKIRLKQSKRKDYYKILGVERSANDDEIKKAYKKRALATHPDRHAGATESEKREQENKFKEIGEAYDVLSDTKKRSRYDNGHDLEDLDGGGHGFHGEMDPNQIFQAFFGGGGGPGGPGMRQQGFSFGGPGGAPGGGQSFSFQFG